MSTANEPGIGAGTTGHRGKGPRALACALALGMVPGAWAQELEEEEETSVPQAESGGSPGAADAVRAPPWKTRLGLVVDVGAPDGLGAAVLMRPLRWLRLHAGATTNSLGHGVRGGVSLIPFELFVSPSLNVDVGHSFNASSAQVLARLRGQPAPTGPLVRDVGYDYASASFGLELSPWRYVTFLGQVGLGYWSFQLKDVEGFIRDAAGDPDITARPLSVRITSPAVKLGLIVYFN
jgi:hypothetical protein